MKLKLLLPVFLTILTLLFITCKKDTDEFIENEVQTEEVSNLTRTSSLKSSTEKYDGNTDDYTNQSVLTKTSSLEIPLSEIDTSKYTIHIKDSFRDMFYFHRISNTNNVYVNYYAYSGYFVHAKVAYLAAAIYCTKTRSLAISFFYLNESNMVYNVQLHTNNKYLYGSFTWTKTYNNYIISQEKITCTIEEGALPNKVKSTKNIETKTKSIETEMDIPDSPREKNN